MDYHVWHVVDVLSSYWKGIVNTVWWRGERSKGRRGWKKKSDWRLDPPRCSYFSLSSRLSPLCLSFLTLMSVLSIGSLWLSYTHIQLNNTTYALLYLLSFCDPLCACITEEAGGVLKGTETVGIHYVVQRSVLSEMLYRRQWKIFGVKRFY